MHHNHAIVKDKHSVISITYLQCIFLDYKGGKWLLIYGSATHFSFLSQPKLGGFSRRASLKISDGQYGIIQWAVK